MSKATVTWRRQLNLSKNYQTAHIGLEISIEMDAEEVTHGQGVEHVRALLDEKFNETIENDIDEFLQFAQAIRR